MKKQIKERRIPSGEIPQVEDYVGAASVRGIECTEGSLVSKAKEVFTPVIMKINGNVEARLRIFSQGNYTIFTDKGGWEGLDLEEFEKDLDDLLSLHESVSKKSGKLKEDALDDFDIDGKIAKDRASQPEDIKAFVEDFKRAVREMFSQGVSVSMENAGLEYNKYLRKDRYKIYAGNIFGLDYKPGALYPLEIALGEYGSVKWYGDLYTHDGPDPKYHPDAIHIKEVSEEIRQDIYQCIKDKWDIFYMTDDWGISFEDCFKMGELEKTSAGGLYSGCFLIRCSFKIPEPKGNLTESTLNEDEEDFDYADGIDFYEAAAEALPMCSPSTQDEVADTAMSYFEESEYNSTEKLSELIYNYIDDMYNSEYFTDEAKKDLVNAGYVEDDELEESVKGNLKEGEGDGPRISPDEWNDIYNSLLESAVDAYDGDPENVDGDSMYWDIFNLVEKFEGDDEDLESYIRENIDYEDYIPDDEDEEDDEDYEYWHDEVYGELQYDFEDEGVKIYKNSEDKFIVVADNLKDETFDDFMAAYKYAVSLCESVNGNSKKPLKESVENEAVYDFTKMVLEDEDIEPYRDLIKEFHAMSIDEEELTEVGLEIKNSLQGPYGIYRKGNGKPDVVINDFESPLGKKPYQYKISVYQTQEGSEDLYSEVCEWLSQFLGE